MCAVPLPYRIIHLPLYCQHLSSLNDLFCSTYFIIKIKMPQRLWFVYEFEFKSEQFTINFKVNKTVKMISVTWSEMNWSKLMNHSSILVNQADFYGRFIFYSNETIILSNDLEFVLVYLFNHSTNEL